MAKKPKTFKISNTNAASMVRESRNCKATVYVKAVEHKGNRYCITNSHGRRYSVPVDMVTGAYSLRSDRAAKITIPTKLAALML